MYEHGPKKRERISSWAGSMTRPGALDAVARWGPLLGMFVMGAGLIGVPRCSDLMTAAAADTKHTAMKAEGTAVVEAGDALLRQKIETNQSAIKTNQQEILRLRDLADKRKRGRK